MRVFLLGQLPPLPCGSRRLCILGTRKLETLDYPMVKIASCVSSFWHISAIWQTDRQTDGRTDLAYSTCKASFAARCKMFSVNYAVSRSSWLCRYWRDDLLCSSTESRCSDWSAGVYVCVELRRGRYTTQLNSTRRRVELSCVALYRARLTWLILILTRVLATTDLCLWNAWSCCCRRRTWRRRRRLLGVSLSTWMFYDVRTKPHRRLPRLSEQLLVLVHD